MSDAPRVHELRLVVTTSDCDAAPLLPRRALAFEVDDSEAATRAAEAAGARVIAEPTRTPWDSLNARLEGPGGLQLTLFQGPAR